MWKRITWLSITRACGLVGLAWEIAVDKVDKPTVLIVLGMMILGTEAMRNIFGGPSK